MALACEDGNSKLIEVVTAANVDDEDRVAGVSITHFAGRLPPFKKLQFSANL